MIEARQGYMSAPMLKFDWLRSFKLTGYVHPDEPLVLFGCYKPTELDVIKRHRGEIIIVWMGKDSKLMKPYFDELKKDNITHVSWVEPIQWFLKSKGIDCKLIKMPVKEIPRPKISFLGNKVYTYLQKGKPEYHGGEMVSELQLDHELLIGDHSILRSHWYGGVNNRFYKQAFIGLALSDYAGGAMSIQEMAVRGIKVVTNVLDLPNCIPWETKEDVEQAVRMEAENIGQKPNGLVEEVYDALVEVRGCFNLEKLLV